MSIETEYVYFEVYSPGGEGEWNVEQRWPQSNCVDDFDGVVEHDEIDEDYLVRIKITQVDDPVLNAVQALHKGATLITKFKEKLKEKPEETDNEKKPVIDQLMAEIQELKKMVEDHAKVNHEKPWINPFVVGPYPNPNIIIGDPPEQPFTQWTWTSSQDK